MDEKNAAVLRKIVRHINSIMAYCADCPTRQAFESDPMRVEATVFNLMQIVWDTIREDLPVLREEITAYLEQA